MRVRERESERAREREKERYIQGEREREQKSKREGGCILCHTTKIATRLFSPCLFRNVCPRHISLNELNFNNIN